MNFKKCEYKKEKQFFANLVCICIVFMLLFYFLKKDFYEILKNPPQEARLIEITAKKYRLMRAAAWFEGS
jgi:hypothetical protein